MDIFYHLLTIIIPNVFAFLNILPFGAGAMSDTQLSVTNHNLYKTTDASKSTKHFPIDQ